MEFRIVFTKRAVKDAKKLEACGLDKKAKDLIKIIIKNPYQIKIHLFINYNFKVILFTINI